VISRLPTRIEAEALVSTERTRIRSPSLPVLVRPARSGPAVTQWIVAGLSIFLAGASLAAAGWYATADSLRALVANNDLALGERKAFLNQVVGGGIIALGLASMLVSRLPKERRIGEFANWADIVSPLMLSFALPLLFNVEIFQSDELLCLIFATIFGLLLERTLRRSFTAFRSLGVEGPEIWPFPPAPRWLIGCAVGGMTLFFVLYFSYYTILHHYQLETRSFDLAIFDNMMWNLLRGKWFKAAPVLGRVGSHIRHHATFDAYLFAPFYALRQKADTLLALQALVAGAGVIPIYLLAKRRLQSTVQAIVIAYAYVIHAPLHGPVFYDFHFFTTAPFWISWVLYFFETRRNGWLFVSWVAAVLLREELSATLATAGLFYLVSGRRPRLAFWGGVTSAACFLLIKFVIMPAHSVSGADQAYTYVYSGLIPSGEGGFGGVLRTVGSSPLFTLNSLLTTDKLAYVLKTMTPVLLLPIRNTRTWILLLPAAIFTLLSTGYMPVIQTYFQYTSNWTSYLFFAAAVALAEWKKTTNGGIRVAAAVTSLAITATALSYQYGAIFQHSTFRGGFTQVTFAWNDYYRTRLDDLYALIARIPKDASVAATETEAPHVSNRADCFTMRAEVDDPDYLLAKLDEVSGGESRTRMVKQLKTGQFGFMEARGGFILWGKNQPHDNDAQGKALMHLTEW